MAEVSSSENSSSLGLRHLEIMAENSLDFDDQQMFVSPPKPSIFRSINPQKRQIVSIVFIYLNVVFMSFASHSFNYTYLPLFVQRFKDLQSIGLFIFFASYATAFITRMFSDKHLHRYWLIVLGSALYLAGYAMLYVISHDSICKVDHDHPCSAHYCVIRTGSQLTGSGCSCIFLLSLILMAMGLGLSWGHASIFGADQIQNPTHIAVYFHGYYFSYQFGIALALYIVSDKTISNHEALVLMGLVATFLSFLIFMIGTPFYLPVYTKHLQDPFVYLFRKLCFKRKFTLDYDGMYFSRYQL